MDYIPSFTLLVLETMALHVETRQSGRDCGVWNLNSCGMNSFTNLD